MATSTAISTGILPLRLENLPFLKNLIAKHSRAHAYWKQTYIIISRVFINMTK